MDIYTKPTDSKRYVPFTSNHSQHCLTNTSFSLARRICTTVDNENVKEKHFKELKKNCLNKNTRESRIETSILKAKETSQLTVEEYLRACGESFISFIFFKILQEHKSLEKSYEDISKINSNVCLIKRLKSQNLLK